MDEEKNARMEREMQESRSRVEAVRAAKREAQRILAADPAELFSYINESLSRKKQQPFSAERIRELTSPEMREARRAETEAALAAQAAMDEVNARRAGELPQELNVMTRIVRSFMEAPDKPGAQERNEAFLNSLQTGEGRHALAMRAVELSEKTDASILLEQDTLKMLKLMREQPELMAFGFVYDALRVYMADRPDLDPRILKGIEERKTLWESAGGVRGAVEVLSDPLHEILGSMTPDEASMVLNAVTGLSKDNETALELAKKQVISDYASKNLTYQFSMNLPGAAAAHALSEKGLMQGDFHFRKADGSELTQMKGLEAIEAGQEITLEWYPSYTSGLGMTTTVSMKNGQLQMTEGVAARREEIPPAEYQENWYMTAHRIKQVGEKNLMDTQGASITKEEFMNRLQAHEEVMAVLDGQVIHFTNAAQSDRRSDIRLQETAIPLEKAAEAQMSDSRKQLDFLQEMRQRAGQAPIPPERETEILQGAEERRAFHEQVRQAVEAAERKRIPAGTYPVDQEVNLSRVAVLLMEPEDRAGAAERNREIAEMTKTPEGRRTIFARAVDYLQEHGEGAFLETDTQRIIESYPEQERQLQIGWAIQASLIEYAGSDECADLNPEIRVRLREQKTLCEDGSDIVNKMQFMASPVYTVMGGMNMDEIVTMMATVPKPRNPIEAKATEMITGQINNAAAERETWQQRIAPEKKAMLDAGKQLAGQGLLSGDISFRNAEGERVNHMDALKKLAAGETVMLERYENRLAEAGTIYAVSMKEGRAVADEKEACTREPLAIPAYDPKTAAVGRAMKQVGDFASFRTKEGENLSWNEGIRRLAQGTEIVIAGKDGALRKASAELNEGGKDITASLKETPVTQAKLDAEHVLSDERRLLDFLSDALVRKGQAPLSEERKQALLEHQERSAQHERSLAAMEARNTLEETGKDIALPGELRNMKRVVKLFLKAPDQPDAEEFNRAFTERLQTPEGRRAFFYQALDRVEQLGGAAFVETDPDRMIEIVKEDPSVGEMGFIVDALRDYASGEEGLDLPQEILDSLTECKLLCEQGGSYTTLAEVRADSYYPLLGGMTSEELLTVQSALTGAGPDTATEEVNKVLFTFLGKCAGAAMEAEQARPELEIGAELGGMGLLQGDVTFRNEAGERMKHMDALMAIADGQSVELEIYDSRKAENGKAYTCVMVDGALSVRDGADITREPVPDKAFDPRALAVAKGLLATARGVENEWKSEDGRTLEPREAQSALLAGQTVTAVQYANRNEYIGREETLRLQPDSAAESGVKLETGKPTITTRVRDLNTVRSTTQLHVQELEKIQQILKQSDPFYVKNSPQFKPMMTALDNAVKFHRHQQGFDAGARQQMTELYRDLNEKVDAYLAVKTEKLRERTDDERGQLRFNVVSSLKSLLGDRHVNHLGDQLARQAARAPQAAPEAPQAEAPQRNRQGGPRL